MDDQRKTVLIGTALVALTVLVVLRTFTSAGLLTRFAVVVATTVAAQWLLERVLD